MANNYKDTLLLGKTDLEMRANLGQKEPVIQKKWKESKIYQQKLALNQGKEIFVLHDGPPYANGNLHIGHALNKNLKDFIVRWKNASGFQAPYIMGWDTHGLPIESAVTKTGVDRKSLTPSEFRELCRKFALEQVAIQSEQFERLGIFTDYEKRYLTLTHDYEITELRLFQKMYNSGLIYRDLKPIYWSPSSESALAESEVEYHDVKTPTVYVSVDLKDRDEQLIIWTTTPWTLPMNQLIAVGSDLEYSKVEVTKEGKKQVYIVATDLVNQLKEILGWEETKILDTFKGTALENWQYLHPIYPDKLGQVVLGNHVTSESGSGLVHTASGFGEDDYLVAKEKGIEIFAPMDNQGKITAELDDPELVGMFYDDTNKIIGQRLEKSGHLLKLKFVNHSYPHDWRTKKPVIYRATLQWFVGLTKTKANILSHVDEITTTPKWAKQRLYQVLDDRNDWTISRQRLWGVPIIGFYDQNDQLVLNEEILDHAIAKLDELGVNAWFTNPADDFLPASYQNKQLRKEKDILDVWFDSGSSAIALENEYPELKRPFSIYLEGNDQYRGWFNASMINSVVYDDKSAYQKLISHGMTTDEKGRKMSKSLGNGIDPLEVANTNGSDVLRLWTASTDYTDDQKIGPEILKQVGESYRKIRNTMRFILANLFDYNPEQKVEITNGVDQYVLHQLTVFKNKVIDAFNNYKFNDVYNAVINYVTKDLSSFYLDFIKDIVYVDGQKSQRRLEVQTVLYEILWALIDSLRPILPHTIEEIYQSAEFINDRVESVHLLDNKVQDFSIADDQLKLWENVMVLREEVLKSLELIRDQKEISRNFEAEVDIALNPEYSAISQIKDLATIFIVSKINFVNEISDALVSGKVGKIKARLRKGVKCERCWGIFDKTIGDTNLCQRCYDVVSQLK